MTKKTVLYLVRHAQSQADKDVPNPEWPLSIKGRKQAESLIPILNDLEIDLIYSSPFKRCLETLEPFAAEKKININIEHDLREKLTAIGFIKNFGEVYRKSWTYRDFALNGTESAKQCQQRMLNVLSKIAQDNLGKKIIISSHGHAIALLLNTFNKGFAFKEGLKIRNPDMFKLTYINKTLAWDEAESFAQRLSGFSTDYFETPFRK